MSRPFIAASTTTSCLQAKVRDVTTIVAFCSSDVSRIGDFQYECYRHMRIATRGDWHSHTPVTNVIVRHNIVQLDEPC